MKWFSQNPHGINSTIRQELSWDLHQFAKSSFPSAMARGGGFASSMFAPTTREAIKAPWRRKVGFGSPEHLSNLRRMQKVDPHNLNIRNAIAKASKGPGKVSALRSAARVGVGAALIGLPAVLTPGSGQEKARAATGGLVGQVGWEIGSRVGMSIGSAILPGVGTAIGAIAGGLMGAISSDEGFQALSRIPDRMVERERSKRNLNWTNDMSAFQTRKASTMRQQSLQAMNRGQMSSRSMLGREGVMLHQ